MINLLPFSARETIEYAGRIHALNRLSILIFAIAAGAVFLYASSIYFLGEQSQTLNRSVSSQQEALSSLEPILMRASDVEKRIDIASEILDVEVPFSELILELGSVLPEGTRIEAIALGEDLSEPLTITVFADRYTEALAGVVRENIVDSELFTEADIQKVSLVNEGDSDGGSGNTVTIEVVALLKNDKPAKKPIQLEGQSEEGSEGDEL